MNSDTTSTSPRETGDLRRLEFKGRNQVTRIFQYQIECYMEVIKICPESYLLTFRSFSPLQLLRLQLAMSCSGNMRGMWVYYPSSSGIQRWITVADPDCTGLHKSALLKQPGLGAQSQAHGWPDDGSLNPTLAKALVLVTLLVLVTQTWQKQLRRKGLLHLGAVSTSH